MKHLKILLLAVLLPLASWTQTPRIIVVVHFEPTFQEAVLELQYNSLLELVQIADARDVKLTLEFSKPWVPIILDAEGGLDSIRVWQGQGHEIGIHHHKYSKNGWDGHSNYSPVFLYNYGADLSLYEGTMDQLHTYMQQISDEPLVTNGTADDGEMTSLCRRRTTGHELEHGFWADPVPFQQHDLSFLEFGHALINTPPKITEFITTYQNSAQDQNMGVVFHIHDFASFMVSYALFFDFLESNGIESVAVKDW